MQIPGCRSSTVALRAPGQREVAAVDIEIAVVMDNERRQRIAGALYRKLAVFDDYITHDRECRSVVCGDRRQLPSKIAGVDHPHGAADDDVIPSHVAVAAQIGRVEGEVVETLISVARGILDGARQKHR